MSGTAGFVLPAPAAALDLALFERFLAEKGIAG